MNKLTKIAVKGYRTFRDVELELGDVNVLIGANGCGKSNFISFFRMLHYISDSLFQKYIQKVGGAGVLLYYRAKVTKDIEASLDFDTDRGAFKYLFRLSEVSPDTLIFNREAVEWHDAESGQIRNVPIDAPSKESSLENYSIQIPEFEIVRRLLRAARAFQFQDTSEEARIRKTMEIFQPPIIFPDAGNLAGVLYIFKMEKPYYYQKIITAIRNVAPYFLDFHLEPFGNKDHSSIILNWRDESETLFGPHELPDGLLRFMALATLLLQPRELLPSVIIIDEPELGLHPAAINLLGGLIRSVSHFTQVIIATQSPLLVDQFRPEDIVVMEREKVEGTNQYCSTVKRLSTDQLKDWLEDYSLGDLWQKNLFGGRP